MGPRPGPRAPGRPLPPAARLPGLPGCPLRELELGNTTVRRSWPLGPAKLSKPATGESKLPRRKSAGRRAQGALGARQRRQRPVAISCSSAQICLRSKPTDHGQLRAAWGPHYLAQLGMWRAPGTSATGDSRLSPLASDGLVPLGTRLSPVPRPRRLSPVGTRHLQCWQRVRCPVCGAQRGSNVLCAAFCARVVCIAYLIRHRSGKDRHMRPSSDTRCSTRSNICRVSLDRFGNWAGGSRSHPLCTMTAPAAPRQTA